ncbi:MAG TPA: alpha-glucosidase [Puia sp.]|nr:alpha-glucosidase [Puia sp.]
MKKKWWKEAVIYQVYPRSFKDSNGDGVGDLPGILSEIEYISSLGVDAVWINPVYASPGEDNGYDISDFRALDPGLGSIEDLGRLIDALHERNLKIIMDMVVNHTSDQHEWFRLARCSREDPHYTWYHWWPAEKGEPPDRCGFFDPEGKAWKYNEATHSWYLHYFSPHQPDLNWDNAAVRREIYAMLKFWLEKGVDGFRMDAISFISKDTRWPVITPEILDREFGGDWGNYYATGPRLHEYLHELHSEVLRDRDAVIIGESSGIPAGKAPDFVGEDRQELDMVYQFESIQVGYVPGQFKKVEPEGYSLPRLKDIFTSWDRLLEGKGWNILYLGNHDQPRMLSRWGDDGERFGGRSAKLLFTFLLTMRGTPSLYNGDELGMTNIRFTRIEEYRDIETIRKHRQICEQGGDTDAFLRDQQLTARDNSRTPFQWTAGRNAGFTTGVPWMPVNENYLRINRELEERSEDSVLWHVRRLLRFRRHHPALLYGGYELLAPEDPDIFAYRRGDASDALLVLLNFSGNERRFQGNWAGPVLINNCAQIIRDFRRILLQPWQAVIIGGAGTAPAIP